MKLPVGLHVAWRSSPLLHLSALQPGTRARKAKDDVDSGNAAACTQERSTIQKAVRGLHAAQPRHAGDRSRQWSPPGSCTSESVLMDVTADGTVCSAPGTVCL